MFKKQLIIEVEGVNEDAVRKAFSIVELKLTRGDLVNRALFDVAAEGIEFDDDLSIQIFTKTFHN